MGRGILLTERGKIDVYKDMNLSLRDIARRIRRSRCVIKNYIDNKFNYGKKYKGKNAALSQYDKRRLIRKASNCSHQI